MHESGPDNDFPEPTELADAILGAGAGGRSSARVRVYERLFGCEETRELGRYRLVEVLGSGGLGTVWRAHDSKLDREVALKLLHEDALRRPLRARRQLFAEAALMAKLNHPNIVRVYDLDEHDGELFVAMELVAGTTARKWQSQRSRSWRELLDVYLAAGAGLAAAHQADLVHGDFKPDNVLIGDDGRVMVTDFAVTRHVLEARLELELSAETPPDSAPDPASSRGSGRTDSVLESLVPLVIGTPAYMAPEQFEGASANAAADQFAFCVAVWEALAGERPFRGRSWAQLHAAVLRGPERDERGPGPRALWTTLLRGLAVAPGDRWTSLDVLLERLRAVVDRRRRWGRRWGVAVAGLGLCSLGFVAAIPTLSGRDDPEVVEVQRQCDPDAVPAELAQRWAPARREAIAAAFGETELPFAATASEHALVELDAWAETWTEARAQACRSTDAAGRTRLLCLDRNLASFTALVGVLSEAEQGTVERIVELLDSLPEADGCEDFELPRRLDVGDPDALQRHAELEAALARVRYLWLVGRTDSALAEVEPLLAAAEAAQADALVAAARSMRGLLWLDADVEGATDELFTAALAARQAGAHALEVTTLTSLAEAEAMRGEPKPERWLDQAALAVELEPTAELRAELASIRGVVANYRGDPVAARRWFEQALAEIGDAPSYRRLIYMHNYGGILIDLDELERGSAILQEAVTQASAQWPAGMPELGIMHNTLAIAELARGQFEAANEHYRRAQELLAVVYGDTHAIVRTIRFNLALSENDLGRCESARSRLDALLVELRADAATGDPLLPNLLVRRALICGEPEDRSLAWADEALELARSTFPPGSLSIARVAGHRGYVLLALRRYADAEQVFAELQPVLRAELSEDNSERAWVNVGYGLALAGQDKPEAKARLEAGTKWLGPRWVRERAAAEAELAEL